MRPSDAADLFSHVLSPVARERECGRGRSVVTLNHYSFTLGSDSLSCFSLQSGNSGLGLYHYQGAFFLLIIPIKTVKIWISRIEVNQMQMFGSSTRLAAM